MSNDKAEKIFQQMRNFHEEVGVLKWIEESKLSKKGKLRLKEKWERQERQMISDALKEHEKENK